MESNPNMQVFSHVNKLNNSNPDPVSTMMQIVKTDIDDDMTAASSDPGDQRAIIFQISSAAETAQAIQNIPRSPAPPVSQPQRVVEQVFMYDMPMDLKEEVPDAVEESESNEEDDQNEEDDHIEEDQNEAEQSAEDEGGSEVESVDDAHPVETAYLNYFRGLLPDYLKLTNDRKELFRNTLTQILREQTEP